MNFRFQTKILWSLSLFCLFVYWFVSLFVRVFEKERERGGERKKEKEKRKNELDVNKKNSLVLRKRRNTYSGLYQS